MPFRAIISLLSLTLGLAQQTFTVSSGATSITVDMTGGSGGSAFDNTTPLEVGDDIEEPKGFIDSSKELTNKIVNFFRGDDAKDEDNEDPEVESKEKGFFNFSLEDYENEIRSDFVDIFGKEKLMNVPSDDGTRISINTDGMVEGGSNIFTLGSEDKQIANTTTDTPSTSNVSVKPTFSDNSKISYILEYGAGVVI